VEESAEGHNGGAPEVRIDLPELAYCAEFGYHFVVVLVGFGHVVLMLSGLALLLHHGPHLVLLRQGRVKG